MHKWLLECLVATVLTSSGALAEEWLTHYERSGSLETPRYEQTAAFCQGLAEYSTDLQLTSFGVSPQGRKLLLLILDKDGEFDPTGSKTSNKAIVLFQAGIHAGEIEGKDAGLMFLRDMVVHGKYQEMLDSVVLLFIPIFCVDGHERFGPYNRVNQNGPAEMGWRTTAQNLNLNRDFLKADAPEMRCWLEMFNRWLPDFLVDIHTTDGADYQYVITYAIEANTNVSKPLAEWTAKQFVPEITKRMDEAGFPFIRYIIPKEGHDVTTGLMTWTASPRFSNGYGAIQNRPFMLIETHMLKSYRRRVESVYELMKQLIGYINANASILQQTVKAGDSLTANELTGTYLPIGFAATDDSVMTDFLGVDFHFEPSEISGSERIAWGSEKITYRVPWFYNAAPTDSVLIPYAYIVPAEWHDQIELLKLHGVRVDFLKEPMELEVEGYRFHDAQWETTPFEGRHQLTVRTETFRETKRFPSGTAVIVMNQRVNRVIVHLLEPKAPDSFVRWGFFDAVLERKEYVEDYVMEDIAARMLASDPQLKDEFRRLLETDSVLAASPRARLDFFYKRSPYFDQKMNVYPISRVMHDVELKIN